MNILIFKTDINTKKKVKVVGRIFDYHLYITSWSIDIDDIDNVLRIEAPNKLNENDIVNLTKTAGFYCEVLPD